MFVMLFLAYLLTDAFFATYHTGEGWKVKGFFLPALSFIGIFLIGTIGILAILDGIPGLFSPRKK
jgi:hypothetical protein